MTDRNALSVVVAGDIGGTKTRLGLFSRQGNLPQPVAMDEYPSQEAASLEEMIGRFMTEQNMQVSSACFGIAGPVIDGRCKVTNLAWEASEAGIRREFGWERVRLINDLSATGLAVPLLARSELCELNPGEEDPRGTVGLVAPGTGLGIALLARQDNRLIPIPSEGGHVDFAPRDDDEVELWRFLRGKGDHVSVERLISGPGIAAIYTWLRDSGRHREPPELRGQSESEGLPRAITEAALREADPLCVETLERFVSILGACAGNLALTGMTTGGIYLGGGICPQILPMLQEGPFMSTFTDKGRFRDLLARMPVRVILNDRAALLGAAWCAWHEFTASQQT